MSGSGREGRSARERWTPSRRGFLVGTSGVVLASTLAACSGSSSPAPSGAGAKLKRGGNFRLGMTGGGAKDLIDGQNVITKPDYPRLIAGWETLLEFDDNNVVQATGLAESVEQDGPTEWTIKLRDGITFQNGQPLTADDVIYSLQRIGTESNGLNGYAGSTSMDVKNLKKLDKLTVRLPLLTPDATVPEKLAFFTWGIVPVGYEGYQGDVSTQIGTGPYKLKSFTPGQESVHVRYDGYWRDSYFDQITVTDFKDSTAQVNALKGGQIDAMTDVPASQVEAIKSAGTEVLISPTESWVPLCMAIDMPPFDDNRVRQAMRLIVDREAMLDQVVSGYGFIGNDLYSPFDPGYAKDLPQRKQDIDQAKALLKAAGHEGLEVDLYTTNGAVGMVEIASVFASQAKAAGVTVTVKNVPNYYGDDYLKLPFSVDFWGPHGYLQQVEQGSLPRSPYNETHWPPKSGTGSNFEDLYEQALSEADTAKRLAIQHDMQEMEYENGGYIIPFFNSLIDGHSTKVQGFTKGKGIVGLGHFGHGFRDIGFV